MKTTVVIRPDRNSRLIVVFVTALITAYPAKAMNWEGHDDWLSEEHHAVLLKHSGPLLPPSDFPACAKREEARSDNAYEQAPLPGVNCRADGSQFCSVQDCPTIDD